MIWAYDVDMRAGIVTLHTKSLWNYWNSFTKFGEIWRIFAHVNAFAQSLELFYSKTHLLTYSTIHSRTQFLLSLTLHALKWASHVLISAKALHIDSAGGNIFLLCCNFLFNFFASTCNDVNEGIDIVNASAHSASRRLNSWKCPSNAFQS